MPQLSGGDHCRFRACLGFRGSVPGVLVSHGLRRGLHSYAAPAACDSRAADSLRRSAACHGRGTDAWSASGTSCPTPSLADQLRHQSVTDLTFPGGNPEIGVDWFRRPHQPRKHPLAFWVAQWYKRETVESSVASRAFASLVSCPASNVVTSKIAGISLGHGACIRGQRSSKGLCGIRKNLHRIFS
jgi:hypothetical protein